MSLAERRGEYWKNVESITDGTLIKGHFISYKYFEDYLPQVKQAFSLPDDIIEEADDKVKKIKGAAKSTCSVHFRVGKDYLKGGYMMNYSYWKKAGILMRQRHPGCKFIVFYDRKNKFVERFIHEFDAAELHGSLVEDMAAIEATDYHIVCNSTYSIMSAVLSENDTSIIRPKHYYSGLKEFPQDVFPENWITVKNDRYIPSYVLGYIAALYGKLRKR